MGMRKAADIVFLVRPPLLLASSTFFFAGAAAALESAGKSGPLRPMLEVLPNLGLFTLVVAAAFVVNQIFDKESDKVNRKVFIMSSGAVSRREGILVLGAVASVAVGLSTFCDPAVRHLVWLGLGLGFAYSVPPLRFKARPVLDMAANVFGFAVIGFAMGWLVYGGLHVSIWARCAPYALAMGGIFLNTCIPDEHGDKLAGDRTSCVVFGPMVVGRAALVLFMAAAVAAILVGDVLCALAVAGSLPAMVAVSVTPGTSNSVTASQLAARLLLVLVCVEAPLLAILGVLVFLGSRAYYGRRFGVRYPDIGGAREIAPGSLG
jgi:4-hydroxybenzoate polyprenyltransferase